MKQVVQFSSGIFSGFGIYTHNEIVEVTRTIEALKEFIMGRARDTILVKPRKLDTKRRPTMYPINLPFCFHLLFYNSLVYLLLIPLI